MVVTCMIHENPCSQSFYILVSSTMLSKKYAAAVPKITGSISAVSSSLIIYLICRSKPKLSTIYHRIMFCMSVADILASTAMALTTLPMPRNDDPYWTEIVGSSVLWRGQT